MIRLAGVFLVNFGFNWGPREPMRREQHVRAWSWLRTTVLSHPFGDNVVGRYGMLRL